MMNANANSPAASVVDDAATPPSLLEQVLALTTQPIVWLAPETIVESGGAVTSWGAYQGSSFSASQALSANRPAYVASEPLLGGQPCVHMSTNNDFLTLSGALSTGTGATLLEVVVREDPGDASDNISRMLWGSDAGNPNCHVTFVDGNVYDNFGTSARKSFGTSGGLDGAHLYRVQSTASLWVAHVDGVQVYTTGTNTFGWSASAPIIGASGGSNSADAKWGALLVFDSVISAADLALWEAYLNGEFEL